MNAYELAEQAEGLAYEIPADWSSGEPKNVATDIADMLRQQADRIAELEKRCLYLCFSEAYANQATNVTEDLLLDRIKELELKLFKVTNRTIATRKKLSKLKKEKVRAYDNGFEDGRKPDTQLHPKI